VWSPAIQKRAGVAEPSQFISAQMIADKYGFTRDQMDAYALGSHQRAAAAIKAGAFKGEIAPITTSNGVFDTDEGIRYDASLDGMANLKPILEGGSITAGNASQMTDGAAALLIVSEKALKQYGLTPLARVHAMAVTAGDPVIMLEEPAPATKKVLERAGMNLDDIDLFEVNEAFAAVVLSWLKNTGADQAKLNVNGGAIALGHPLGASGAKLMTQLVHGLRNQGKRYGLQVMCEGGGVANATIIEAL
jgi:acetyl-CoA C-acetyltransferase